MPSAAAMLLAAATLGLLPPPSANPFADNGADPLLAHAGEEQPKSVLAEVVQNAVDASPRTGETAARTLQAEALVRQRRAALYPSLDLEVSAQQVISRGFSNTLSNAIERSRPAQRVDGIATLEQTLLDGGAIRNRLTAERARAEGAKADAVTSSEDVALDVVTVWYDVWVARADERLAGALVDRNRAILEMSEERARSGAGSRADVARVEASVAGARARLTRAYEAADAAEIRYFEVVGAPPPADVARSDGARLGPVGADEAMDAARETQAVAAARARAKAAGLDVKAARGEQYPRISAGIDAQKFDLYDRVRDHDVRARLTLRHRLFGGGSGVARLDEAKARESEASFRAALVEEEAVRDAGVAQASFVATRDQVSLLRDAYVALRQSRDAYAEEFRVRRGTLNDLLQVEVALVDAASAYLRGVARSDIAGFTLLRETGQLLPTLGVTPRRIESER